MSFFQDAPKLGNQYTTDRVLRSHLTRVLPPGILSAIEPDLIEMGELAGGELFALQQRDRNNEPRLVQWDAWGRRVDRIELTEVWDRARRVACEKGLIATAYERTQGRYARFHQLALAYLFHPSTDTYSCPLAMSDGAARTLLDHHAAALIERAVPQLISRDPASAWTSGQWMTERNGGSDVGSTETVARREAGCWRLYGTKWFASAASSEMALTLARPEGNLAGGRGLALFYLETRTADGAPNGIFINRLKEKLGTRKLPTAELTLDGAEAMPVAGLDHGVKAITPMLTVTRTWNAVCSAAEMRRGLALARDYARRRVAFGSPLSEKPLHLATLAGLQAEAEGAFQLAFRAVELLGLKEAGELDEAGTALLRLITPLAKLCTARQAMAVVPEVLEVFGGAGYIEDTGVAHLLRDAQVLPIWEGTTNVLALDVLRAIGMDAGSLETLRREIEAAAGMGRAASLVEPARCAVETVRRAVVWLEAPANRSREKTEAGARQLALTLARSLELALLVQQAQWSIDRECDGRAAAAAERFARHGIDQLIEAGAGAAALADDRPLPV